MTRRQQQIAELQAWAEGSLPLMAAVDFVVATGTALDPMVSRAEHHTYLDLFDVDDDEWLRRVGGMSSGQRATWELARSIAAGELHEWFWRLDARRKLAFTSALTSTIAVVGPEGRMWSS